jgi:hypothetical protein
VILCSRSTVERVGDMVLIVLLLQKQSVQWKFSGVPKQRHFLQWSVFISIVCFGSASGFLCSIRDRLCLTMASAIRL